MERTNPQGGIQLGEPAKQNGDERRARPGDYAVKRSGARSRSEARGSNDDGTDVIQADRQPALMESHSREINDACRLAPNAAVNPNGPAGAFTRGSFRCC